MRKEIFDPLDYRNIANSVVSALLSQSVSPLPPAETFSGAGVYALYYNGSYGPYRPLSGKNTPIYVGKAVPAGGRRAGITSEGEDLDSIGYVEPDPGLVLYRRLREHAESISAATNLDLVDFRCRYLAVTPIWIVVAEGILIRRFRPIWNVIVDGFGNHDPGSGRYRQKRSGWDTLHPGRSWAAKCQPARATESEIVRAVRESLRTT